MSKDLQASDRLEILREASASYADGARSERLCGRISLVGGFILGLAVEAVGAYQLVRGNIVDGAVICGLGTATIAGSIPVGVNDFMEAAVLQHKSDRYEQSAQQLAAN